MEKPLPVSFDEPVVYIRLLLESASPIHVVAGSVEPVTRFAGTRSGIEVG